MTSNNAPYSKARPLNQQIATIAARLRRHLRTSGWGATLPMSLISCESLPSPHRTRATEAVLRAGFRQSR